MSRRLAVAVLGLLVPALSGAATPAELERRAGAKIRDGRIVESRGQASVFGLGDEISAFGVRGLVERLEGGTDYRARDTDLLLHVDDGRISEISVRDHYYLTQRLIRPQRSTFEEVARGYGLPAVVCTRGARLFLVYSGIGFSFETPAWRHAQRPSQEALSVDRVVEIVLTRAAEAEGALTSYERGLKALSADEIERAIAYLERSACASGQGIPLPGAPRRSAAELMPHFYLARAWERLDQCEAARFEASMSLALEGPVLSDEHRRTLRGQLERGCG